MIVHLRPVGAWLSECGSRWGTTTTNPTLATCEKCLDQQSRCQYCEELVDEEVQDVFYTSSQQTDHYACVPVSEKR